MREMVQFIKATWHSWQTGEKLHYEGEHYQVTLDAAQLRPGPLTGPSPALTIAAVGPGMMKVAAETATACACTRFSPRNI